MALNQLLKDIFNVFLGKSYPFPTSRQTHAKRKTPTKKHNPLFNKEVI